MNFWCCTRVRWELLLCWICVRKCGGVFLTSKHIPQPAELGLLLLNSTAASGEPQRNRSLLSLAPSSIRCWFIVGLNLRCQGKHQARDSRISVRLQTDWYDYPGITTALGVCTLWGMLYSWPISKFTLIAIVSSFYYWRATSILNLCF